MGGRGQVPGVDRHIGHVLADRPRAREFADARLDRALHAFLTPGGQERRARGVIRADPIVANQVGVGRAALRAGDAGGERLHVETM